MKWSNWIREQVYSRLISVLSGRLGHVSSLFSKTRTCKLCLERHEGQIFICAACISSLPQIRSCCRICSIPLVSSGYCGQCLQLKPLFDRSHCNFIYSAPIDSWLYRLKSKRQTQWAKNLAILMLQSPPTYLSTIDAFTFVPSTRWHLITRGFNPAELIARELARVLNKPIIDKLAVRSHSRDQKNLNKQQRIDNVKHHLHSTHKALNAEHVMLIDDVMTTGSTANTISAILKKSGASQVSIWCLARTPKR